MKNDNIFIIYQNLLICDYHTHKYRFNGFWEDSCYNIKFISNFGLSKVEDYIIKNINEVMLDLIFHNDINGLDCFDLTDFISFVNNYTVFKNYDKIIEQLSIYSKTINDNWQECINYNDHDAKQYYAIVFG